MSVAIEFPPTSELSCYKASRGFGTVGGNLYVNLSSGKTPSGEVRWYVCILNVPTPIAQEYITLNEALSVFLRLLSVELITPELLTELNLAHIHAKGS